MTRNSNRIVIANSKGGVTKTTSLCEVAAHGAKLDKKILCIDLDPQGNTSSTLLGRCLDSRELTIFDLLVDEEANIREAIAKATDNWPNIWVIPGNQKLERAYKFLESEPNWISRLDEVLEQIEHNFDAVLIDTPPAMGMLTKMAIKAANKLLIPTDTSRFANDGDETILGLVNHIQKKTGHKLDDIKMVLTLQQKKGSHATRDAIRYLTDKYDEIFLPVDLPHCIKAIEAQRMHVPPVSVMSLLDSDHKLYQGYEKISQTLIQ